MAACQPATDECAPASKDADTDAVDPADADVLGSDGPTNVMLIVLDDLGPEMVSTYGVQADAPPTPNIDALADQGVQFNHVWQDPWCSPSRAMMLTGRHARRYGIGRAIEPFTGDTKLPDDEITLAELIRDESPYDYHRALFGKWHLSSGSSPDAAREQGFERFVATLGNLDPKHSYDDRNQTYFDWESLDDGVLSRREGYITTATVDDTLAWTRATPEPWFTWVGFHSAHTPWHNPPSRLHSYGDVSQASTPTKVRAMVEAVDSEIGRLLDGLGAEVRARTTFIIIGDNGTTVEAGVGVFEDEIGKSTVLEHGLRVPLIISGPAVDAPGREVDAIVQGSDLFRTIAQLTGVDLDAAGLQLDSVSLLPYLADPGARPQRDWIYAEAFEPNRDGHPSSVKDERAASDGRFKLARRDGRETFTDLGAALLEGPPASTSRAGKRARELLERVLDGCWE